MPAIQLPAFDDVSATIDVDIDESLVTLRQCESVGYWFEAQFAPLTSSTTGSPTTASPGKLPGSPTGKSEKKKASKAGVKLTDEDFQTNWYDVLKLVKEEASDEDEIRAAYRRRCLETHPDKQKDRSDELFKKVQRAFDLLGNPETRRAYDSSRPFDDSIPGENVPEDKFYETFGPCFERNKKWGVDSVIPSLGDDNTPLGDVNRFYTYWMTFNSWRDFSHECELEEIQEGMCREEKRFYQRENQRLLDKARKMESKRVRTFVERAQALDPRLRKHREEETAKREKEVADRQAERNRLREEERRRKQEAADSIKRKEEERVQAAKDSKTAMRAAAVQLNEFLDEEGLIDPVKTNMLLPNFVRTPNIRWAFNKMNDPVVAKAFVDAVVNADTTENENGEVPAVLAFNEEIDKLERKVGLNRYGEPVKAKPAPKPAAPAPAPAPAAPATPAPAAAAAAPAKTGKKEWDEEDLHLLQKAIVMFPGGTLERWRKISTHLRDKFTEEEVLAKTKEMEKIHQTDRGVMKQKMPSLPNATHADPQEAPQEEAPKESVEDWTAKQQKQLETALRELKDYKEKDKFQKIAAVVEGKNAKQCFDRYKHLRAMLKK